MTKNTFTFDRKVIFWLAVFGLSLLFVIYFRDILLPFVLGIAIAYFLDPIANYLEKIGLSRLWATLCIVLCMSIVLLAIVVILTPLLATEIANLASNIPDYFQTLRTKAMEYRAQLMGHVSVENQQNVDQALRDLTQQAAQSFAGWLSSLVSGGLAFFNFISLLLITPVVTFYLLKDWNQMVATVDQSIPRQYIKTVRRLASEIDEVMAGFVRGQITVLLILGAFYAIALQIIGLNFGLLIGITAGLISFIPFVGSAVGFLLAGGVAIVQYSSDWVQIVIVLSVFLFGQLVEGNFLSPKIIGDRVRLHPVWLIFALFVFGYLLGFIGLLIAVPVAAALGVVIRFWLDQYRKSDIYTGSTHTS